MEKLIIASRHLIFIPIQRIIHQYFKDNDIELHIAKIREAYRRQRDFMVKIMQESFPADVSYTKPEGGMFLWVTLPEVMSSLDLFNRAMKEKVAFVPGQAFYTDGGGSKTMRLNFSNSDNERIFKGITRLAKVIKAEAS